MVRRSTPNKKTKKLTGKCRTWSQVRCSSYSRVSRDASSPMTGLSVRIDFCSRPSWRANARSTAAATSAVLNFLLDPIFRSQEVLECVMGDEPSSASRFVECLRSKPRAQANHGINRRPGCRPPLDGAAYSDNRSHRPPASQVPWAPWRSRPQALALR